MCTYSMIADHFREKWPICPMPQTMPLPYHWPNGVTITKDQWDEYQELKRKAQEYDARTGQPDCVKPEIEDWERAVESVLRRHGILPEQNAR